MAGIFNVLRGGLKSVLTGGEWASHAHTAFSLLTGLKGFGTSKLPSDAGDAVEGFHGIWGLGDEREMQVLLIQLEQLEGSEGTPPKARELVEGFIAWHFKWDNHLEEAMCRLAANHFRSFITKMSGRPGIRDPKEFKIDVTDTMKIFARKKKGEDAKEIGSKLTKTTLPVETDGTNNSLEFLKGMARTIASEPVLEDGYKKLLASLKNGGVPTLNKDRATYIYGLGSIASQEVRRAAIRANNDLIVRARRTTTRAQRLKERPKDFLDHLIKWW